MMSNAYDPWELLLLWNKEKLSLEEAMLHSLKNQVKFEHHRKLNDRDIIRQQEFIEEIFQILEEYRARIKFLEEKCCDDDDKSKGNGMMILK